MKLFPTPPRTKRNEVDMGEEVLLLVRSCHFILLFALLLLLLPCSAIAIACLRCGFIFLEQ